MAPERTLQAKEASFKPYSKNSLTTTCHSTTTLANTSGSEISFYTHVDIDQTIDHPRASLPRFNINNTSETANFATLLEYDTISKEQTFGGQIVIGPMTEKEALKTWSAKRNRREIEEGNGSAIYNARRRVCVGISSSGNDLNYVDSEGFGIGPSSQALGGRG